MPPLSGDRSFVFYDMSHGRAEVVAIVRTGVPDGVANHSRQGSEPCMRSLAAPILFLVAAAPLTEAPQTLAVRRGAMMKRSARHCHFWRCWQRRRSFSPQPSTAATAPQKPAKQLTVAGG